MRRRACREETPMNESSLARRARVLASVVLALLLAVSAKGDTLRALGPGGVVVDPPFGPGESFTFELKYGFITAGTAVLGIPEIIEHEGRRCYHIVSVAESNDFISVFFPVRDVAESYLDARQLVSRRFEKQIREGDYRSHDLVLLDQDRNVAVYPDRGGQVVPLALDAQDILSSLYYVRLLDLNVEAPLYIENHADRKNYPLEIRVHGRERVDVPAGSFDCIVVEPVMRTAGLFTQKGTLKVWLTDDEARMPVMMKSKVIIGSVAAVLTEFTRGAADRTAPQ